jgi:hypothetical protein
MSISGSIPYVGSDTYSFASIVNYSSRYDASVTGQCTENGDMRAYISSVKDKVCNAELVAKYTCNNGTFPDVIPFYAPYNESNYNYHPNYPIGMKLESTWYCFKSSITTYQGRYVRFLDNMHGTVKTDDQTLNIKMCFSAKNTPEKAMAIAI